MLTIKKRGWVEVAGRKTGPELLGVCLTESPISA